MLVQVGLVCTFMNGNLNFLVILLHEIFLNFKFLFVQNLANNGEPVVCLNLIFS
jgi:hypothetical protein